jgi:3-oxoacyl-[acyl-carrier protein] reductase
LDAVVAAAPKGATIHRVVLDLTSEESCRAAVKEVVSLMGGLDVVINCGASAPEDVKTGTFELYNITAALHVSSVFVIVEEALPELKKNKGAVVNITSGLSVIPSGKAANTQYNAMKAAQDVVTRSLALQLAADGVRVNAVSPGVILTEGIESAGGKLGLNLDQVVGAFSTIAPAGRLGQAEEIADAILFLSSERASFITGAVLPVDGGATLTSWANKELL